MRMIELSETESTNSWLKSHRAELDHGDAVTALRQTAGRGRMGHSWLSDKGMLPLSVLLKAPPSPETVTLCAGIAVCRALDSLFDTPQGFGIKWPNDIVLRGCKLCGILCESASEGDGIDIICGVGLNLCQSEEYFSENDLPHGGSVRLLTGLSPDRTELAARLAAEITECCSRGFFEFKEEYRRRCVTLGKEVRLIKNGTERIAFAVDIADNGYLLCRDESGVFAVSSGEVSVRGLYGYI